MRRFRTVAIPIAASSALLLQGCAQAVTGDSSAQVVSRVTTCDGSVQAEAITMAGDPPRCQNGTWGFLLPGRQDPPATRRSEVLLMEGTSTVAGHPGSTLVHEAVITPYLGPSAQGDGGWHVVWQLHGPVNGVWRGPAMGLRIRNGELALSGGSGHPNHDWSRSNYEWVAGLTRVTDGRSYRVRIETYLSPDPSVGWVTASVDGRTVLDHWKPVSPDGHRPGTIYPGQPTVESRIGLYRGSQGEQPPTYAQGVLQKVVAEQAR